MGNSRNGSDPGSLFISCGEASGDQYSRILTETLRSKGFHGDIWGMLGPQGVSSGAKAVWDSRSLSLMGVSEVLGAIPRLIRMKRAMTDKIVERNPAGVVVIDSPDFHLPLVKALRHKGYTGKVFYIAPPTVWAWRQGRVSLLASLFDLCFPLFKFEKDFLESRGVKCRWFGHPLLSMLKGIAPTDIEDQKGKTVALLPGSRRSEVRSLMPVLAETANGISKRGFRPVFSVAPGLDKEAAGLIREGCRPWRVHEGPGSELMAASEMVIGASGTAAVEALILGRFMIVLYRASLSSWLTYKALVRTRWISIPNVLAGQELYPELLQCGVSPERILHYFDRFTGDTDYREGVIKAMKAGCASLGHGDAGEGWASSILEVLGS
ncbi:MAG: lipid-A-disaccharide synthase [Thermovirgaceae bacterium]|nr:lipid-A-disaccharide synthase [Synergistaceae bacterium]